MVRSATLPHTGVETVVASRVAVTTQVKPDWLPPRSAMITGSEAPTTVVESMATNIDITSAAITGSTPSRAWAATPGRPLLSASATSDTTHHSSHN